MCNNRSNTHPNICKRSVHCLLSLRPYPLHSQISEDTIDSMGLTNAFPDLLFFNCCESYLKVIASRSSFAVTRFSPVHFIEHSLVYRTKNFVPKRWACVTIFIPILPFMHVCECKKKLDVYAKKIKRNEAQDLCNDISRLWLGCMSVKRLSTKIPPPDEDEHWRQEKGTAPALNKKLRIFKFSFRVTMHRFSWFWIVVQLTTFA